MISSVIGADFPQGYAGGAYVADRVLTLPCYADLELEDWTVSAASSGGM